MEYRHLGKSGLLVSSIGFGNMINYDIDNEENVAIVKKAFDSGINFFDTAENYAAGKAELALGKAFKVLNLPREQLVVSTKIINRVDGQGNIKIQYGCKGNAVNRTFTLSRKHVLEGVENSLKRLQLDYVDVIFAHVFDPHTSMEEICRAFNQVIEDGKALYWATSNFNAAQIQDAINVCDRLGLHRPIAEQCQYNMLERKGMEVDLAPLFDKVGYGTTIWSPLAGGLLTGKYNNSIPSESRVSQGLGWIPTEILNQIFYDKFIKSETVMQQLKDLAQLSQELGVTQAQLSIAWTLRNKDVSTAITGARSVQQLEDTLQSLKVVEKLTPEVEAKIESILNNKPQQGMNWRKWAPKASRRD